jgi:hypothetical protein
MSLRRERGARAERAGSDAEEEGWAGAGGSALEWGAEMAGWGWKRSRAFLASEWGRRVCFAAGLACLMLCIMSMWLPAEPLGQEHAGMWSLEAGEDETPLEPLDRGDGVILKHGLDHWKVRRKAVLVVGPESSGSKLVARAVARRLVYPGETHPTGWEADWDGHGAVGNETLGTFVVHRSLPHNDHFPELGTILSQLHYLRFEVFVVIATRDREISFRSVLATHQPDAAVARREHHAAVRALVQLLKDRKFPTTVFSHEALMLLGDVYYNVLFDFLHEPLASSSPSPIPSGFMPPSSREANAKYIARESLLEAAWRLVMSVWAPRRATVGRAPPSPPPPSQRSAAAR